MKILIQTDDKCTNCDSTGYIAPGTPCPYCERTGLHRKWVDVTLNETDKEIERLKWGYDKINNKIDNLDDKNWYILDEIKEIMQQALKEGK